MEINYTLGTLTSMIWLCMMPRESISESPVKNPNLALFKPTRQASTLGNHQSANAVNGDTWNDIFTRPCAANVPTTRWQWWSVDLKRVFIIKSVRVTRSIYSKIEYYSIEVSKKPFETLQGFPGFTNYSEVCLRSMESIPQTRSLPCTRPLHGRYVRFVQSNPDRNKQFYICEFEVYSHVEGNITTGLPSPNNLALHKPAWSSNPQDIIGNAFKAVDGNLNGDYNGNSCTFTGNKNKNDNILWWMVDLENNFIIESVRLRTRTDCCQDRLQDFLIEVTTGDPRNKAGFPDSVEGNALCHRQIDIVPYTESVTYKCDRPIVGRYVRLIRKGIKLTICELEVLGRNLPVATAIRRYSFKMIEERRPSIGDAELITAEIFDYIVIGCIRLLSANIEDLITFPYILINYHGHHCHYYQFMEDIQKTNNSAYVIYANDG